MTGQTCTCKEGFSEVCSYAVGDQSAGKTASNIRIQQHLEEVENPFSKFLIGGVLRKMNRT